MDFGVLIYSVVELVADAADYGHGRTATSRTGGKVLGSDWLERGAWEGPRTSTHAVPHSCPNVASRLAARVAKAGATAQSPRNATAQHEAGQSVLAASRSQPVRVVSVVTWPCVELSGIPAHACAGTLPPPSALTYWPWFFTDSVPGVDVVALVRPASRS